jgi:predicted exporter
MVRLGPKLILVLWLLCLLALASWNIATLRLGMDLSQFLPHAASEQAQLLISQLRAGPAARSLLIRIAASGPTAVEPQRLAGASRALAEALRDDPNFARVANGADTLHLADPHGLLYRYRFLLGPPAHCADALNVHSLQAALHARLEELASGLSMLDRQGLTADPTACYRALLLGLVPAVQPARHAGVWMAPGRDAALLVAITSAKASDIPSQRVAVARIQAAFAGLSDNHGLELQLAGPSYFAIGSEARIRTETTLLSIGASLLVALILILAYRSIRLMLLGILPLASGLLIGVSVVSLVYGQVHGITLALAITLLGVALDYPVHVYAHFDGRSEKSASKPDPGPPIWRVMLLGMATTVLGYAALAWTSFDGLAQLGLLAAIGLATAALTSRYLLVRLMPPGYRLQLPAKLHAGWRFLPALRRRTGLALLVGSILAIALTLLISGLPWETDIRRLSTVPEVEIERDRLIRAQLGAPDVARLLYVTAPAQGTVLSAIESATPELEELREDGVISGFDSVTRWLPSPPTQLARRDRLPDRAQLASALATANDGLPFRLDRLTAFLDAVERSRKLAPLTADAFTKARDVSAQGHSSDIMQALAIRTAMLIQPFAGGWAGLVTLNGADHSAAVGPLSALADRHGLVFLDLRAATADLLERFFGETLEKLMVALICIVLALVAALRDARRVGAVLLPIGLGVSATFLITVMLHGSVNLFHLVSLLLVAGLAIDYSLFLGRPVTTDDSRLRSLYSVTVGAVSSAAMFGILALSDIPALHAIGMTVTIGIACSYFAALLLARGVGEPLK